jgi:hypothetical protein
MPPALDQGARRDAGLRRVEKADGERWKVGMIGLALSAVRGYQRADERHKPVQRGNARKANRAGLETPEAA